MLFEGRELPYLARECLHFEDYWILTYGVPYGTTRRYRLINGHKTVKESTDIHELRKYVDDLRGVIECRFCGAVFPNDEYVDSTSTCFSEVCQNKKEKENAN